MMSPRFCNVLLPIASLSVLTLQLASLPSALAEPTPTPRPVVPIVVTGDLVPMPDGPEPLLQPSTTGFALNDKGDIAFQGLAPLNGGPFLPDEGFGIWVKTPQGLRLVASDLDDCNQACGGQTLHSNAEWLRLSEDGDVAFLTRTAQTFNYEPTGLWVERGGQLARLARAGQGLPGLPGRVMSQLGMVEFTPSGRLAFTASSGTVYGVWGDDNNGVPQLLGTNNSFGVSGLDFYTVAYNDAGNATIFMSLGTPNLPSAGQAIAAHRNGTNGIDAAEKTPAPLPGYQFTLLRPSTIDEKSRTFFVAFYGTTSDSDFSGLFAADGNTVRPVVLPDEPVANLPGATLASLIVHKTNRASDVFLGGTHRMPGGEYVNGLYLFRDSSLELITPSCFDAGVGGAQACVPHYAPELVSFNDAGQIAFPARLEGPGIYDDNDESIWATNRAGELVLIARTGDTLEVAPGVFKILYQLHFQAAVGSELNQFNNRGQLAFMAIFTDGTRGLFISNAVAVPEPAGITLSVCLAFVGLARVRPSFRSASQIRRGEPSRWWGRQPSPLPPSPVLRGGARGGVFDAIH